MILIRSLHLHGPKQQPRSHPPAIGASPAPRPVRERELPFFLQVHEFRPVPVGLRPVGGDCQQVAQPVEVRETLGKILKFVQRGRLVDGYR